MSNENHRPPDTGLHRLIDILRGSGKRRKPASNPELEAARTARQSMLWILDKGDWKPVREVEKIQWEKKSNAADGDGAKGKR